MNGCDKLGQMRPFILLCLLLLSAIATYSQSCPKEDPHGRGEAPEFSSLHGTLQYHDELRQWLGLKLDRPACGEFEVQLVFIKPDEWRRAESFRECTVMVSGKLYESPTGYYSADMAISDPELKPDPSCRPYPVKPDPTAARIPTDLRTFHASVTVDYRGKGYVEVKAWRGEDRRVPLEPWQAFVNYSLTGSEDVMWFVCREDFQIKNITQDPKSPTGIFQDEPDLNSVVLQAMDAPNTVTFTCEKKRIARGAKRKPTHSKTLQ
jgi:hypothetical protein